MAKTIDAILAQGMNEGIEKSVLPLPQLRSVQNARLRKSGRWGKRFGYDSISPNINSLGTYNFRCVGSGFGICDDRFAKWDTVSSNWIQQPSSTVDPLAVPSVVSGWSPSTSFFPVPQGAKQVSTACSSCYALNYLWVAGTYTDPVTADSVVRVTAVNPTDQTLVFTQDILASSTGFGGATYPKLITCGSTVVLTYISATGGPAFLLQGRTLTSIGSGFGAFVTIDNTASLKLYDASPYSSTQFLCVSQASGAVPNARIVNASNLTTATLQTIVDGGAFASYVSIVGSPSSAIYVGYAIAGPAVKVRVYTPGFGAASGTATVGTAFVNKPLLCLLSGGGCRVVYDAIASGSDQFKFRDVTQAGALLSALVATQTRCQPISVPFAVGSNVYLWVWNRQATTGGATLIRLPTYTEFPISSSGSSAVRCPIELTVNDYVASQNLAVTDGAGVPLGMWGAPMVTEIGTTAAYAFVLPTAYTIVDAATTVPTHDYRLIQARHFADEPGRRSVQPVAADRSNFVPLGALTRIGNSTATELGFALPPRVLSGTPSAGGGLTASSSYVYSAVYRTRNDLGRLELSKPAPPLTVTTGVGQGTVTLQLASLSLTARSAVQVDIYRTIVNGPTFYYVGTVSAAENNATPGQVSFVDTIADTTIAANAVLYTQVGQTLPAATPPACRFLCTGGNRLFLGGLLRPEIVQCSNLLFGDQSPNFPDNDAYRLVLPAPCTGLAWMDGLVLFTADGIFIASGEGPDPSGIGDLGPLTKLPFELGCTEPRSVVTFEDGTFFLTSRGLYMLPRGFGSPVPAGDMVMDTFASYPYCGGAQSSIKLTEQTIRWVMMDGLVPVVGRQIVYDIAHKTWSVDWLNEVGVGFNAPQVGIGQWYNGEVVMVPASLGYLKVSGSSFSDNGNAISLSLTTGDVRPFGPISEGTISRIDLLAELRSSCTLTVSKTTEFATSPIASRVFASAPGDYQFGQLTVTEVELGSTELREAMGVNVTFAESSTTEGLAVIAMSVEHEGSVGLKRVSPLSRVT